MDTGIKDCSEVVYQALCEIVGYEEHVKFNRVCSYLFTSNVSFTRIDNGDIQRNISPKAGSKGPFTSPHDTMPLIDSGSRAEGLNFKTSDHDIMCLIKKLKVIQSPSEKNNYESPYVLLMEKNDAKPGFVRLKPLLPAFCDCYTLFFTRIDQTYYMSSGKIKDYLKIGLFHLGNNVQNHGPCLSTLDAKFDFAPTLSSDTWPSDAAGCVKRLFKREWPSIGEVRAMISDGCLFVPIGGKTSPREDVEWRMSFSLAEKRLVHSMKHTQFLTYALLKIFLKEVIEKDAEVEGLLCSYFLKTLVFWEIIDTQIPWMPCYFLQNVWNCFRRLLSWIQNEYCPNFFIPENNMFHEKVTGNSRQKLQISLGRLYREGYIIFLQIPSVQREWIRIARNPRQNIGCELKRSTVIKMLNTYISRRFVRPSTEVLEKLESLESNVVSEFSRFIRMNELNFSVFRILCSYIRATDKNRTKYRNEKDLLHVLKASSPDCVRSKIFMAIYFCRCGRYDSCIRLLYKVPRTLKGLETIYMWDFDSDKYASLGGDLLSISEGMYRFTASHVLLDSETCITEIKEECRDPNNFLGYHPMAPLVLANFLLFLCYLWKQDLTKARVHMRNISHCLRHETRHLSSDTHAISWEILGISQDILGDFKDSLISYGECRKCVLSEAGDDRKYISLLEVNEERSNRIKAFLNMQ